MKTSTTSVGNIVLAAVLTLPLSATAVTAEDMDAERPPVSHGDRSPHGMDRDVPPAPGTLARGPGFGPGRLPFLRGVELSDEQQDKIFAILHAEAPYLREQSRASAKAREALHALVETANYDDAQAAALAKQAATAETNIALQHVRTQRKLLALLTQQQRKQQADERPRQRP